MSDQSLRALLREYQRSVGISPIDPQTPWQRLTIAIVDELERHGRRLVHLEGFPQPAPATPHFPTGGSGEDMGFDECLAAVLDAGAGLRRGYLHASPLTDSHDLVVMEWDAAIDALRKVVARDHESKAEPPVSPPPLCPSCGHSSYGRVTILGEHTWRCQECTCSAPNHVPDPRHFLKSDGTVTAAVGLPNAGQNEWAGFYFAHWHGGPGEHYADRADGPYSTSGAATAAARGEMDQGGDAIILQSIARVEFDAD